ncbi:hypothetical protein GALMADRAFT_225461 [Galerina marginata CBS 339.88]|uniref:Beta-lactamase-related domain-containing protein n=1 Tax=Galerina marginata (strain CBS 339.88) TaxID=685588 RepID=A0A067T2I1_GALM3|nr:hypothetical protein GALMADRAFT_225461 [Galerina marginata CBS 339.88]
MVKITSSGKEALDALAARIVSEKKIPGFVFGASSVDEEIYFNGGGDKIVNDPTSGKVDENTVFWVCSMTKFIVHLAALQLIEQGKFTADNPVSDFFPDFATLLILSDTSSPTLSPPFTQAKTIMRVRHLLNFSSGLFYPAPPVPNASLPPSYVAPHNKEDPHGEFFKNVKGDLPGIPIRFEPGTDFAYGYSSDILGFIVEKVTGKTLEQYVQANVFQPLGMGSSFYRTSDLIKRSLSLTFRRADGVLEPWNDQVQLTEQDHEKVSLFLGGIGIYTPLRDYLTLLRHLLQIQSGKSTKGILSQATVDELFVPVLTDAGSKSLDLFANNFPGNQWSTGLAVVTHDWPNRRKKGSAYWSGWAGTYFFMDPTTGVAAVFGTQIVPSRDPEVIKLYGEFEETLYAGLAA